MTDRDGTTMNAHHAFNPITAAPRDSRMFVQQTLASWGIPELADIAGLLTSELVTNVVCHAATAIEVDVTWSKPILRVEVRDRSFVSPAVRGTTGPEGGYGLRIVAALAQNWGVPERADGKDVWFTMERSLDQLAK